MSWNPNQGQNPNQQPPYGSYTPPPQDNPYGGQQYGYGQQPQQPPYGGGAYQQYQQPPPYGAPASVSPLGPSSIGLDPKVSAGLGYLIGILAIIFFFIEKQNRFVRFHNLQAILLGVSIFVLYIVLVILGIASAAVSDTLPGIVLGLGGLVVWGGGIAGWLIGMINAFQGKYFKLPIIGDWAYKGAGAGM